MKRGNGEGSVFFNTKKHRYEVQVTYFDSVAKKTKRKIFTSRVSKQVAFNKSQDFARQVNQGIDVRQSDRTLVEWLIFWVENYKKNMVRERTYERYVLSINKHIKPQIGNVKLKDLTTDMLQAHLMWLLTKGGAEGKGLAPRTINGSRRVLIQALNDAVDCGYVVKNVALRTKPLKTRRPNIYVLTHDEAKSLMIAAKKYHPTAYLAIVLALGTGMRLGECFGLNWEDIDFERKLIHVKHGTIKIGGKGPAQADLKTESSRRTIPMPEFVIAALNAYKNWQKGYCSWHKLIYVDKGLVFTNWHGDIRSPASFSYHDFKTVVAAAGLPSMVRFHDLRHTHATWLLEAGVNVKVVSERLGHASIRITLETYTHALKTMQDKAVDALNGMHLEIDTGKPKVIKELAVPYSADTFGLTVPA